MSGLAVLLVFIILALIATIALIVDGALKKSRKQIMFSIIAFLALCTLIYCGLSLFITSM